MFVNSIACRPEFDGRRAGVNSAGNQFFMRICLEMFGTNDVRVAHPRMDLMNVFYFIRTNVSIPLRPLLAKLPATHVHSRHTRKQNSTTISQIFHLDQLCSMRESFASDALAAVNTMQNANWIEKLESPCLRSGGVLQFGDVDTAIRWRCGNECARERGRKSQRSERAAERERTMPWQGGG